MSLASRRVIGRPQAVVRFDRGRTHDTLLAGFTQPQGSDTYDFALARYLPTYCVVPKLEGKTLAAARRSLRASLTAHPARVRRVYSKAVRRPRVASQTPR